LIAEPTVREHAAFVEQYIRVRREDGHGCRTAEDYQALPLVARSHRLAREWRIRRDSFETLVQRLRLGHSEPRRVLDLGAGNAWLSARLAAHGHHPVAVDICADDEVGLGAARLGAARFPLIQAHFDALPFAPHQFDIVVLNASLHYAGRPEDTLSEASRMLAPAGALVVMDSPMFDRRRDGEAMVREHLNELARTIQVSQPLRQGAGFLTFAQLQAMADTLGLRGRFAASGEGAGARLRRAVARYRLRRAPARFGVWIAT
jgi:SAM-dependent methyltransferase